MFGRAETGVPGDHLKNIDRARRKLRFRSAL
jgi:hypothetical protein